MNSNSYFLHQVVKTGISSLLFFFLLTSLSYATTSADVKYEADVLPENNSKPFIRSEACDVRSITTGILNIIDADETAACTYYYRTDAMSSTDSAVFEFRLKVNSADSSFPPPNRAIAVGFVDGTKLLQVGLSDNSIAILGLDGVIIPGTEVTMATNVFHDYRVIKNAANTIEVYVDAKLVISISYASLPAAIRLNENKQFFGAGSIPGASNSEWDYFRYVITNPTVQASNDTSYKAGYEAGAKMCQDASTALAQQQEEIEKLKLMIQDLQTKNQSAWLEGRQQGVTDGRQQCINDPASCQLFNLAQVEAKIATEVEKATNNIIGLLPRGIRVSLCKKTAASMFCQGIDGHNNRLGNHHPTGRKNQEPY